MSSSRGKKVHYERGTKGEKSHRHQNSRDSGVGSSSASDRASLGTSPLDDSPFNYQQIRDQRQSVTALQEALDAANDKVRQLEAANARLSSSLAESNKDVRFLKKERVELINKNDALMYDLEEKQKINEILRREASARAGGAAPPTSRTERRTTPPRREQSDRPSRRDNERSQGSHNEQRKSFVPAAPQAPPAQNPFTPLSPVSTRSPSVSYSPTTVTYAPAPITYATSPVYTSPPSATSSRFPNDGLYHPHPL